jgi:hypothetical protein
MFSERHTTAIRRQCASLLLWTVPSADESPLTLTMHANELTEHRKHLRGKTRLIR